MVRMKKQQLGLVVLLLVAALCVLPAVRAFERALEERLEKHNVRFHTPQHTTQHNTQHNTHHNTHHNTTHNTTHNTSHSSFAVVHQWGGVRCSIHRLRLFANGEGRAVMGSMHGEPCLLLGALHCLFFCGWCRSGRPPTRADAKTGGYRDQGNWRTGRIDWNEL